MVFVIKIGSGMRNIYTESFAFPQKLQEKYKSIPGFCELVKPKACLSEFKIFGFIHLLTICFGMIVLPFKMNARFEQ